MPWCSGGRGRGCRTVGEAASKAGINGLIGAAFGVSVNGVEPGTLLAEGFLAERSAENGANAVLFPASDEAGCVTRTTIIVDGGQLLPEGMV